MLTTEHRRLILGSSSPHRRHILERLGVPFKIRKPDIEEKDIRDSDPVRQASRIAHAKAETLIDLCSVPSLAICADTVTVWRGEIREKPLDADQARSFLADYGPDEPIYCVTGISIADTLARTIKSDFDVASVTFNSIPPEVIETVVARGDVLTSAGGFMIDDPDLTLLIAKIFGLRDAIQGLPLRTVRALLADHEYCLPH